MKKFIIITSIFNPTVAVKAFARLKDYQVVVVGDDKTPANWHCKNVVFLSMQQQQNLPYQLIKHLPHNHYCRKIAGYLYAIGEGAEVIIDTDDDNIPKKDWDFPLLQGDFAQIPPEQGFVNVYSLWTKQKIWARGLPLSLIRTKIDDKTLTNKPCKVGIWQGLADEDPDVDAIYRLTDDTPCIFLQRQPLVLGKGTLSPFNSQNTLFAKELFPLLYLPCFVSFRFTDILRGLVAQPIMWQAGYQLGFTNATVVQKRNPHDYFADFISEIPMYQYADKCAEITAKTIRSGYSIPDNLYNVYAALCKENIVKKEELQLLKLWLEAL